MASHTRAALIAGAALAAWAPAAWAQHQHHQHHQTPPETVAGHEGHTAHKPADAAQDHTAHSIGHDGHMGHVMTSPYGPWSANRDASGTSWQPDMGRHGGVHATRGDWTLMGHALLNLVHTDQGGPRGGDMTFAAGMVMAGARRDFANGDTLNLRAMVSPDPFMGKEGYPLLLAAGETADGVTPLIDRQHPHDLFMELSASYARRLTDDSSLFVYIGLPGEPAFGPPAFMHRMSAMDSPEAPITHHWLDSTHIVFGVATLGYASGPFKIEASSFRGREPDQDRYDIESPDFDSWSVRASFNPSPEWSLQVSRAEVTAPEQLAPYEDEVKWSASAIHTRHLGQAGWWATTAAWGRKTNDHGDSKDAWLLETAFTPDSRWTVFARAEHIQTDELVPAIGGHHGDIHEVGKLSVGALRDWRIGENTRFGLGALYAFNRVPAALEPLYGGDPNGAMVFLRLRID